MNFVEIIKKVSEDKRLIPDLMKIGNNFRAISESAILDVISPVLNEFGVLYVTEIKDYHLDIREAYCTKGKKLQFIATLSLKVRFYYYPSYNASYPEYFAETEAVGMGIDDNDKAMGKAYTYALKYALLKFFRLRYGDDPDANPSEPLLLNEPKTEKESKKEPEKKTTSKKKSSPDEKPMSEAQRDYILGMMKKKGVEEAVIIGQFGYEPSRDEFIPMPIARSIIKYLEDYDPEKFPF